MAAFCSKAKRQSEEDSVPEGLTITIPLNSWGIVLSQKCVIYPRYFVESAIFRNFAVENRETRRRLSKYCNDEYTDYKWKPKEERLDIADARHRARGGRAERRQGTNGLYQRPEHQALHRLYGLGISGSSNRVVPSVPCARYAVILALRLSQPSNAVAQQCIHSYQRRTNRNVSKQ